MRAILNQKRKAGASILVVLMVLTVLLVLLGVALDWTLGVARNVRRSNTMLRCMAIGEGAMENNFVYWREICRLNTMYAMPTSFFYFIPLPAASQFPDVQNFTSSRNANTSGTNYTIANCKVIAVDPQLNPLASDSTQPAPAFGPALPTNPPSTTEYYYLASADVSLPDVSGNVTMNIRRVFRKELISPWSWAIFYVDPLEIHPGPAFTVTGWVHTNSDLYTGHSSLTFADKVTYGHDWTIGFAPGDSSHNGETPQSPNWPSNLPPALDISHQPFGLDASRIFNKTNTNTNDDSYHELIEIPDPNYTDPLDGKRYYDQAGVKITVDASNNVMIYNESGTQITNKSKGADLALYNTFIGALSTNTTIQDNREAASIRLVTLDLNKVQADVTAGKLTNFNQIIYITDTSASSTGGTPKRGVRLKNGAVMPDGGLTIASGNPIYVQGNFNTGGPNGAGGSGAGGPPSNNAGDYTKPTVSNYTRQPCAIIGDAVNILSNAWVDGNSTGSLSARVASNTTVNAAIVSGIIPSSGGNYSGGAENFPRFLEDWSGKSLCYYGSMVELYQSQQSIGKWGKANVYNPPNRQWFFDPNFRVTPPPGTLMIYNYIKDRWYIQ
jgi:hypothetical protein